MSTESRNLSEFYIVRVKWMCNQSKQCKMKYFVCLLNLKTFLF